MAAPAGAAQRCAIVTGASPGGIGYAVVQGLARRGWHVTLACRSQAKAQQAMDALTAHDQEDGGEPVERARLAFLPLDMNSLASVSSFAQAYLATARPLHLLVNNAGLWSGPLNDDGVEAAFMVHHVSVHHLTSLLRERLVASRPARIINVNTMAYTFGALPTPAKGQTLDQALEAPLHVDSSGGGMAHYGTTKLYGMLDGRVWHQQLRAQGVCVYSVQPGSVRTEFVTNNGARMNWLLARMVRLCSCALMTPAQAADCILWVALAAPDAASAQQPFYGPKKVDGQWRAAPAEVNAHASNDAAAARLFAVTQQLIQRRLEQLQHAH